MTWYRIGDLARELGVETHVIRYWETEFPWYLKPPRSKSGHRWYEPRHLAKFRHIKWLLKTECYTIQGARRQLKQFQEFA